MTQFSKNAQAMRSSEIRRLMALAADPSIISFAGGMPANSLFPLDVCDALYGSLSTEKKQAAFQYGPTPGLPPLLASLSKYLAARGIPLEGQKLIVTTGGQQGLSLTAKVFLDAGDVVITEDPTFIGALAAFKSFGAELVGVPMDDEGIRLDDLRAALDANKGPRLKLVYLNPCFSNPAGTVYSRKRREEVLRLLEGYDVVLLEDDPYSELYFDETDKQLTVPCKSLYRGTVPICYVSSFAKIFGPGMRLGWILGPADIVDKCEMAKQSEDACTSSFTQVLASEYLSQGKLPGYLSWLRPIYKRRAQLMLDALQKYMPAGVTWTRPRGGFYVWVTMPPSLDSSKVFAEALKKGAAFVIGSAFDPQGTRNNSFRLAFSAAPEDKIASGVQMISDAVRAVMMA